MINEEESASRKEAVANGLDLSDAQKSPSQDSLKREIFLVKEMALVRDVSTEDVWKWLAAGWSDLKANTAVSISYAALFIICGLILSIGFYFMGLALAFVFQVWIRISFTVFALNFPGIMPDWGIILTRALSMEGVYFGISIAAVGAVFATCIFFIGAFSMPMMMDRNSVLLSSLITSAYAVVRNRNAMILWATIIVICTGIGLFTAGIGLIVTLPLIGHATWHAYKQVMSGDLQEGESHSIATISATE